MPAAHVIEVNDVSKRFKLYHQRVQSLKERFIHLRRRTSEEFWALRDINLTVTEGETIGILGHNGSGKSTLLKCIGGILQPTTGEILVRGRIASLLELGAGMHPELTGRENVYMNAAILGISRAEVDRRFDEIVGFAELEAFIDNQVKHYSSGMYVRLAFAVAVNVDPDILLIDEVLAVGDEAFQKKCLDRMTEFQRDGKTLVVVSHAADLMRQIANRVVVLDHGRMVANGPPGEAIRTFREYLHHGRYGQIEVDLDATTEVGALPERAYDERLHITDVELEHAHMRERAHLLPGEPLRIRVGFEATEPVADAIFWLSFYDKASHQLWGADTDTLGVPVPVLMGRGEVVFDVSSVPMLDGEYLVSVSIRGRDSGKVFDWFDQGRTFDVRNPTPVIGTVNFPVSARVSVTAETRVS